MPSERADINEPPADEFASPDLELLAQQLRADAAYLAGKYPARELPPLSVPRSRGAISAFVSGAAVAMIVITISWWQSGSPPGLAEPQVVDTPHRPLEQPMMLPASVYFELTAPEKEAVLDLFEERALAQASLSI